MIAKFGRALPFKLAILVTCFTISTSVAAAAADDCNAALRTSGQFSSTVITVDGATFKPHTSYYKSQRELTGMATGKIALTEYDVVNGLTIVETESSIVTNLLVGTMPNGGVCVWPALVNMGIQLSKHEVFVASDFPDASCAQRATENHEYEHVRINLEAVERLKLKAESDVRNHIASTYPRYLSEGTNPEQFVLDDLSAIYQLNADRIYQERDMRHAQLDSPESYMRTKAVCRQWHY
jgi:hypothetical protein